MKKTTILLLTLALLLGLCPAISAEEPFQYEQRSDGVWITGANTGGDLTVPAEIGGVPVVGLADGAFYNRSDITSVTLPEGLREIGSQVFTGCSGIRQRLEIPDSVEYIDPWSLWTLPYAGKDFSAADRYRLTSRLGTDSFCSTGTLPGYTAVREGGLVYWLHGGEAELVSIRSFTGPVLTLPAKVGDLPLTSVGPYCCCSIESPLSLRHVIVPGTVKRLRAHAFQEIRLQSLYLAEGVERLEPCSLAVGFQETSITVPASAQAAAGPLFCRYPYIGKPTVYAYGGSEAARLALSEGCTLVRRDAVDGRCYGVYEGLDYYIEDGQAVIYGGRADPPFYEREVKEVPAEIDGFPVTEVAIGIYSGSRQILIPASVTKLNFKEGGLSSGDLILYYPGTYAERFCRQNRLNCQSVYSYWGPPFDDVTRDSWYYDAVCYVYGTGLMIGTGSMRFSPNGTASRAMLVTVLWRLSGAPETEDACPFEDVQPGSWYEPAVRWAYGAGVSVGVSETAFAPDAPVTREQIAVFLLRYAALRGSAVDARAEIVNYPDAGAVSDWAVEAIQWARAEGVIKGNLRDGDVYLDPQSKARRCEIAEMLMRFCAKID